MLFWVRLSGDTLVDRARSISDIPLSNLLFSVFLKWWALTHSCDSHMHARTCFTYVEWCVHLNKSCIQAKQSWYQERQAKIGFR